MTKFASLVLLTALAGCLDTNVHGGDVGTDTSGAATATGGSGAVPSSSGSSSGGNVAGSIGSSTGSSSGGSTIGGTTGGTDLAQACTDFVAGAEHVDRCDGSTGPGATIQQCEAALAVCTAQDDQIVDAVGLCFQGVVCSSTSAATSVLSCAGELAGVSAACFAAAGAGGGGQPP